MERLQQWLFQAGAPVWGLVPILVVLGIGAYLTLVLRGIQLRRLPRALRLALLVRNEPAGEGDVSHFQALTVALAGTTAGSMVGVATALAAGGAGALVWLWGAGLVSMATRYAEALLGVHYREVDRRGDMAGGAMYYLARGLGGRAGRALGGLFAVLTVLAALATGAFVSGTSAAGALQTSVGLHPAATAVLLAVGLAAVVPGGVRAIGRITGVLVPALIALFLATGLWVLVTHGPLLGDVVARVFREAFTGSAAAGGVAGVTVRSALRAGLTQGVATSQAGRGTGGIAAAAARTHSAPTQALVAMTQPFLDTLLLCTVVGLAILASGVLGSADPGTGSTLTGVALVAAAFRAGLPGDHGGAIVSLGLAVFAFSTTLAWAYYGERAAEYLFGLRATTPFRLLFVLATFAGGLALHLATAPVLARLWNVAGALNGAMAVPNLIGLLLLSGVVARETRRALGRDRGR